MKDLPSEKVMIRCIELAITGLGNTAPNPLVGSVIVHGDRIIGEGWHRKFGGPHAEVYAIQSVTDKSLLHESTLYVNLEPCCHTGKTPPCTDLIIEHGIPRVVIGTPDPNTLVAGKGIDKLRRAGISVEYPVLPDACRELNRRFFTYHTLKRPWVILKWAQTKDGFIDVLRDSQTPVAPNWISNDISRIIVHRWRTEEQGILVGTRTALLDNPRLNAREWPGKSPLRMVIDRQGKLPASLHLFDNTLKTFVFTGQHERTEGNTHYLQLDFSRNIIPQMLSRMALQGIQSIIVEGGRKLLQSFIDCDLWDEARVFTGLKEFGSGVPAPELAFAKASMHSIREDRLTVYRNQLSGNSFLPKT